MTRKAVLLFSLLLCCVFAFAAPERSPERAPQVPRMIKFSGTIANAQGTVAVTFALYKDSTGGAPLWLETQNVTLDEKGRFAIYLGADHAHGVPADLFASGEARWLGVQPEGQPEQARVLLVSVPYALKAADADTLGGHRLSEFVLAGAKDAALSSTDYVNATAITQAAYAISGAVTNALPKFTSTAGDMTSSAVYELNGNLGIGTATPARSLHIKSASPNIRIEDTHFATSFWELQQSAYMDDWFGFLRYDTSLGSFQAVPAKSMIISNEGKFGLGINDVYNKMSERVNVGAGNLKLWGASGTDGIIFPDGTKQTTASLANTSQFINIYGDDGLDNPSYVGFPGARFIVDQAVAVTKVSITTGIPGTGTCSPALARVSNGTIYEDIPITTNTVTYQTADHAVVFPAGSNITVSLVNPAYCAQPNYYQPPSGYMPTMLSGMVRYRAASTNESTSCPAGLTLSNGSCVDTNSDPQNCGTAGHVCAGSHQFATCTNGVCGYGMCSGTYANCDGNNANGCEVNLGNDMNNCGSCGNVCPKTMPNGTVTCSNGACTYTCNTQGLTTCGYPGSFSCVNINTDANNCGGCGVSCQTSIQNGTGTGVCTNGLCGYSCNTGYTNCSTGGNNPPYCVSTSSFQSDPNNCGGCNIHCVSGSCSSGKCQ